MAQEGEQTNAAQKPQETPSGGASSTPVDKGKGKAIESSHDVSMADDDDESSEEESGGEDADGDDGEEDDDEMQEINTENIISTGRRTRGKNIDFAKAAEEAGPEDEDEDEDDDFEDPEDSMQH